MNITEYTLMALAAAAGTLTLQPLAWAADTQYPAKPVAGDRLAALRDRMQETARELDLTPEQKEKLQTIVREQMEKLRELRQDNSLSPEEKREKFRAAREGITEELKKVLTPEQFEKWKAKQATPAAGVVRPAARLQESIQELNLTEGQKEQLYEELAVHFSCISLSAVSVAVYRPASIAPLRFDWPGGLAAALPVPLH